MKMSCNGCRILRKGCSDECELRPCLEWIKSSRSQANATLFLAKFYGRAGLMNLINAGPTHLRPDIFKSLLFEACGRIINPIYGSVGLLASGKWERCQAAVDAILAGSSRVPGDDDDNDDTVQDPIRPLFHGCDIRHLLREPKSPLHRVSSRNRFKRSADTKVSVPSEYLAEFDDVKFTITGWDVKEMDKKLKRATSHDSVETVEPALVNQQRVHGAVKPEPCTGLELELTLRCNSLHQSFIPTTVIEISDSEE